MSEIQKALRVLGLEPGSSKDAIQRRYKRLIFVWHPDRFPTDEGKEDANEELKKINNARDILFKHFDEGGHKASGCECQATAGATNGAGGTRADKESDYRRSDRKDEQEAEARRRDEERRRRASQAREEYARKQREEDDAKRRAQAQAETLAEAQKKQAAAKDNSLRWKVAFVEIAIYVGALGLGWAGLGVKSWWHDFSWHWQNDHPQQQANPPTTDTTTNTGYVPSYTVPPQQQQDQNPYINTQPSPSTNPAASPAYNNGTAPPINTNPPGYNWKPLNSDGTSTDTSTSSPDYSKYLNP